MSPFSKVEMSPFVVLKWKLQDERCGAGGGHTTNEPESAKQAGSYSTSQTKEIKTTPGGRAVVDLGASGKATMQSLPGPRRRGGDFQTTRSVLKQSPPRENNQQS